MNRRMTAAALSAFLAPGAGQIYARHYIKGAALLTAAAAILAAAILKTWEAAWRAATSLQPDAARDAFALARRIYLQGMCFYDGAGLMFAVVWAIGVADAFFGTTDKASL